MPLDVKTNKDGVKSVTLVRDTTPPVKPAEKPVKILIKKDK